MPWFKVDDKLHDHRKTRRAGVEALGLWTLAGSWCADNLTDGFIPAEILVRWAPKNSDRLGAKLVASGLWEHCEQDGETGYLFHEWKDWQPARVTVLAEREAAKARMRRRRAGRGSGERSGEHPPNVPPNIDWTDTETEEGHG